MISEKFIAESWNHEDHQLLGHVVENINRYLGGEEIELEDMEEYWGDYESMPIRIKKLVKLYYTDEEIFEDFEEDYKLWKKYN